MVPNKPNMTTIICRKFPRIGAHWKPRKSKIDHKVLFLIHGGSSVVHISLLTITKNQPLLITLSAPMSQSCFQKHTDFFLLWALVESCLVFSSDAPGGARKGEMCVVQARIIHSRHMCNAGETGANN